MDIMENLSKRLSLTTTTEGATKSEGIPRVILTRDDANGHTEQPVLVRKTSIRRRVSKDESQKSTEVTYGNLTDVYDEIRERMMSDKGVQNTIEALKERWRMIMFMYDDCVSKIEEKLERDRERRHTRQKQELIALSIIYSAFSIPILIMVFIVYLFVIFF